MSIFGEEFGVEMLRAGDFRARRRDGCVLR
jgi:hypothetical protein